MPVRRTDAPPLHVVRPAPEEFDHYERERWREEEAYIAQAPTPWDVGQRLRYVQELRDRRDAQRNGTFQECVRCRETSFTGQFLTMPESVDSAGQTICPRCLDYATLCDVEECRFRVHTRSSLSRLHPQHYYSCHQCGSDFPQAERQNRIDSLARMPYCWPCLSQTGGLDECPDCEAIFPRNFLGDCPCGTVAGHSYKPPVMFHYVKRTKSAKGHTLAVASHHAPKVNGPFMGFELEVEYFTAKERDVMRVIRKSGLPLYCKHDGSLHDGVEIVSHPATLAAWRAMWPKMSDLYGTLRGLGCRSYHTSTCGLHVHVNKSAFDGKTHLWRLCQLVYRNPREIFHLSQRSELKAMERWATLKDVPVKNLARKVRAPSGEWVRYTAVNLNNAATAEFRFFRGTLEPSSVMRALESVQAFVEFTRNANRQDLSAFRHFRAFVLDTASKSKGNTFGHLAAFLNGQESLDTQSQET